MGTPCTATDRDVELVALILGGDRHVFHELVTRHERSVYRTALAITQNAADAEDVTQETFLRALQHLDQFRAEARFSTWLIQIAVNTARMRLRKEHASLWESLDETRETQDGQMVHDVSEWRENPEEQFRREELQGILQMAMSGMHPSYRAVLMMRDVEEYSTQETAEALGISIANVKTRLLRARLQLRDRLAAHFKKGHQA